MKKGLEDWEKVLVFLYRGDLSKEEQVEHFCAITDMDEERARLAFAYASEHGYIQTS